MDYEKYGKQALKKAIKAKKSARRFAVSNPYGKRQRTARFLVQQRQYVGRPVGYARTKSCETVNAAYATMSTRTLYDYNVVNIPPYTNDNNAEREHDQINLRGLKIDILLSTSSTCTDPMYFHWALVQPRYQATISTNEFFSADGITAKGRGIDFAATDLSAQQFNTLPISTDRFTVLIHKKVLIGQKILANVSYSGIPYVQHISRYVPIKRQLQYENTMSPSCSTPIYICFWADHISANAGGAPTGSHLARAIRVVAKFKEPGT